MSTLSDRQQKYLSTTRAISLEDGKTCRILMNDGSTLMEIRFAVLPSMKDIRDAVTRMVKEHGMGVWAIEPITRQVECTVNFRASL